MPSKALVTVDLMELTILEILVFMLFHVESVLLLMALIVVANAGFSLFHTSVTWLLILLFVVLTFVLISSHLLEKVFLIESSVELK